VDVDIEVRRRGNSYILIAHKFGVVVRSKELQPGIEELERRVAIVSADFCELGIPAPGDGAPGKRQARSEIAVAPSLLIIVTVGAVLAAFVFLSTAPIVIAMAGLRGEISTVTRSAFASANNEPGGVIANEPGGVVARLGRLGIDFIVKFSQTLDQVTPERKEELRAAIRNIAREVNLVVEDVRTAPAPSAPPPSSGDKR
jgi:hypothetical protein